MNKQLRMLLAPVCLATLGSSVLAGCNIYPSWEGAFSAGPADPFNYPPAYLGTRGDRARPASGSFTETQAYAGGERIGYYAFPFSPVALNSTATPAPDPLSLTIGGNENPVLPTPVAYNFDGSTVEQAQGGARCIAPVDYTFNPQRDEIPLSEQAHVFTKLPQATYSFTATPTWSYAPVVKEVAISDTNYPCQAYKEEEAITKTYKPIPDSTRYMLWPIIDTGAAVYRLGQSAANSGGVGAQRFGWFNHYLVAYLDGGPVPTVTSAREDGTELVRMRTQRLFFPRSQISTTRNGNTTTANGSIGQGYDVLEAARGRSGFSPVCAVFTYDLGAATANNAVPKDADEIVANYESTFRPANPPYVYCLQLEASR